MSPSRLSGSRRHGQSSASPRSPLGRYSTPGGVFGAVLSLTLLTMNAPAAAADERVDADAVQPTVADPHQCADHRCVQRSRRVQ